jgi:hypothetical protein
MRRLTLLLTLCCVVWGCSDANPANAAWVGDWTATGNATTKCATGMTETTAGGTVVIASTSDSQFSVTVDACTVSWTVSASNASAATLDSGQSCRTGDGGTAATLTFSTGTGTLAGDSMTLTEATAATGGCTVTEALTLTRVTKPEMMK